MFKKVGVFMLQTDRFHSKLFIANDNNHRTRLFLEETPKRCIQSENPDYSEIPYHLFFVSDEPIKGGDWITDGVKVYQAPDIDGFIGLFKIIATTDHNLKVEIPCPSGHEGCEMLHLMELPQPTQEFLSIYVKAYNRGQIIDFVNVEYKKEEVWGNNGSVFPISYTVKVDKDNQINIQLVKDSWNLDEVKELIRQAYVSGYENGYVKGDWHNAIEDIYKEKL